MEQQHVIGAGIDAATARTESRPNTGRVDNPAQMRRGVITAVLGETYRVGVMGATGQVEEIENVPAWGGSFLAGDKVTLVFEPTRPVPYILSGGGSSGGGSGAPFVTACLLANGE